MRIGPPVDAQPYESMDLRDDTEEAATMVAVHAMVHAVENDRQKGPAEALYDVISSDVSEGSIVAR